MDYISTGHLRALVVSKTDETILLRPKTVPVSITNTLPVKQIQPWSKNISVAVVSWRWDGDRTDPAYGSRNLFAAVRYAKSVHIQYLLIDVITIDQNTWRTILIDSILDFAAYYENLPVICAYQKAGTLPHSNIRRPWIFSELQRIRLNEQSVVHVKHTVDHLQTDVIFKHFWDVKMDSIILGLLYGTIQMTSLFDLTYIVPAGIANLVSHAALRMKCNDYLLSAILLCKACQGFPGEVEDAAPPDFAWVTDLKDYSLRPGADGIYHIRLKEQHVGEWRFGYNEDRPYSVITTRPTTFRKLAEFLYPREEHKPPVPSPEVKKIPPIKEVVIDTSISTGTDADVDGQEATSQEGTSKSHLEDMSLLKFP